MNLRFKKNFKPLILKGFFNKYTVININSLKYGTLGVQLLDFGVLTYNQINSIRIKVSRCLKRWEALKFKIYIRIFFTIAVTQKPKMSRMGKGCGSIKSWVGLVKPGSIFLEVNIKLSTSIIKNIKYIVSKAIPYSISVCIRY